MVSGFAYGVLDGKRADAETKAETTLRILTFQDKESAMQFQFAFSVDEYEKFQEVIQDKKIVPASIMPPVPAKGRSV